MPRELSYNKNKRRRQRLLVNKEYKSKHQVMKLLLLQKPKIPPVTFQIFQLKVRDFNQELRC